MTEKRDVQVIIDNKMLTISGYESEDYLQKVAMYINNKLALFDKEDGFKFATKDIQHKLIEINIADDYFKEKEKVEKLQSELTSKTDDLYDLKHEVINKDMKIKSANEELAKTREALAEAQKRILQLETELKERRNK